MQTQNLSPVIPAKAGNHIGFVTAKWIPAFAGMTRRGIRFVDAYSLRIGLQASTQGLAYGHAAFQPCLARRQLE
jgi:hypothetical protein